MNGSHDPRLREAIERLRQTGWDGAEVRVEGREGEVAAVSLPDPDWARAVADGGSSLASVLRPLGFRYVALDLASLSPEG